MSQVSESCLGLADSIFRVFSGAEGSASTLRGWVLLSINLSYSKAAVPENFPPTNYESKTLVVNGVGKREPRVPRRTLL